MRTQKNESFESLEQLVSISAYHVEFHEAGGTTDVILNMSLRQPILGGGENDPLTFIARLKAVDVEVILPAAGDLRIHPKKTPTKHMDRIEIAGSLQSAEETLSRGALGFTAGLTGDKSRASKASESETVATKENVEVIKVTPTNAGTFRHYVNFKPGVGDFFDDHKLDQDNEFVLATIKDNRSQTMIDNDREYDTQPPVRIEVRFLRRDLSVEVTGIHDKRAFKILAERTPDRTLRDKRQAAAECFLRDLLIEKGLQQAVFWNDATIIKLAEITSEAI